MDATLLQERPVEQVITTLRVEVVDGPDKGKEATSNDQLSIGTAKDNGLAITDFTVSRYHLEITVKPNGIAIADLGSTNGTYVGTVRVEKVVVPAGTLVKLGGTTIKLEDAGRRTVKLDGRTHQLAGMLARSPQMVKMFSDIERVAQTPTSVLVVGESGTGKERVAEAIHERSPRAKGPLVTIDCGALASSLLASELFGHERGAFTGADRVHVGAFERAGGGTIFLDELGELPQADQVALLGVLERKRIRRVGGTQEIPVDVRVVAATNRDLRAEVNNGRFRHDLYHRLAVVVMRLPPLRERREDIALLIEHFAREYGAAGPMESVFDADTLARWMKHPWPGNIRELRNAVEAMMVVGTMPFASDEPSRGGQKIGEEPLGPYKDARAGIVGEFERSYLTRLMAEANGNVSQAARIAQMDRSHLIDLLRRHQLKT
ncbi:MAG: sigma 54-interacting transcriptional regulator [Kofleriaceae bacterium]